MVDDASTDGTAAAIRTEYPWVEVIDGSGALFWNRGMYVGFGAALQRPADYYLWLNDDTVLVADALQSLLQQSEQLRRAEGTPVIVVGATAERSSGRVTYGGRVRRSRLRRFNFELVWDEKRPVPCEAIEGNCVLIPREVAQARRESRSDLRTRDGRHRLWAARAARRLQIFRRCGHCWLLFGQLDRRNLP